MVEAVRRVDVFVGDRPFQLVAPTGGCLGVLVDSDQLEVSAIQDEIMVAAHDRPHGICLDESEMTRKDGVTLRVARYERATQIAVEDPEDGLLGSATCADAPATRQLWEQTIVNMFERGDAVEDVAYALEH